MEAISERIQTIPRPDLRDFGGRIVAWSDVGTWIGTTLSFLSMGVATYQAIKASRAATLAEEMRNQIAARNAHSELSTLNGVLNAAIRAMDKYGPGTGPTNRRGSSISGDAEAVRVLTAEMSHHQAMLTKILKEDIHGTIDRLNELLTKFSTSKRGGDDAEYGRGNLHRYDRASRPI
jgi:hypothetical protein